VKEDYANQKKLEDGINNANSESDGKVLQKQIRTQARRDWGLMGSTY
jgi:hypothetical protein